MATRGMARIVAWVGMSLLVSACTIAPPEPRPPSEGHLDGSPPAPVASDIPAPVKRRAFLPPPIAAPPEQTFTVVVNEVPARELLFALARDAGVNVDVHPKIEGNVTLNAIDQTLPQILDRISRQLDLRHEERNNTLVIMPDGPVLRTYRVDYVNVTRKSSGTIGATSSISAEGESNFSNTSESDIGSTTNNQFWETLETSLQEMVSPGPGEVSTGQQRVILNRESGLVLVRATAAQHEIVQEYLDRVMASATRQVLIEATIVEVQLSDRYQAGIDWRVFTRNGGLLGAGITLGTDVGSAFTAGASGAVTGLIFNASDAPTGSAKRDVQVSISLLNEFGDTQVLSSPKVMTLNNQPAILKVVDNEVYFDVTADVVAGNALLGTQNAVSFDTDVRTVSVGLVMNVTPQISDTDQVTLNVRPTITRIRDFVDDPSVPVALRQAGAGDLNIQNRIPVVQVRETESVMRVGSGQLAVLGGLMQDRQEADDESVPGFAELPAIGEAFKFRDRSQSKTELVVFLRPTVIRRPDVAGDLSSFQSYLPEYLDRPERRQAPFVPVPVEGGVTK